MKIISGKQWEKINQELIDLRLDINMAKDDEKKYLKQIEYLQKELNNEKTASDAFSKVIEEYFVKIETQRLLIKNLKSLLTKNGIDYKALLNKKKGK